MLRKCCVIGIVLAFGDAVVMKRSMAYGSYSIIEIDMCIYTHTYTHILTHINILNNHTNI